MISIVIPTYKEEHAIEKTIRQFEKLEFPHEVIIGDGRSPDNTKNIARAAGAIVVETPDDVRSPARQRNIGAQTATGEFIMFIDSTVILPDINAFVQQALKHFDNPRVVGLAVRQRIYPEVETFADRVMLGITNMLLHLQVMGSGKFMMTRRSSYDAIGGLDENLIAGEDQDFFRRLKKIGTVIHDPKLTFLYSGRREHAWGWPKLIYIWMRELLSILIFGKSVSKEWSTIR